MALLIDTTVVNGLDRRGLGLGDLATIGPNQPATLSSVSASEVLVGVLRSAPSPRRTRRAQFIETVFASLPILPFDLVVARIHARMWTHLATAGTPIGGNDLMIAATALRPGRSGRSPAPDLSRPDWARASTNSSHGMALPAAARSATKSGAARTTARSAASKHGTGPIVPNGSRASTAGRRDSKQS